MEIVSFTIIDTATGRVVSTGTSMDPKALLAEGQHLLYQPAPINQYWKYGSFRKYPEQPDPGYLFDYENERWYDPRSLAQLKEDRWQAIKLDRTAAVNAGVVVGDLGRFDANNEAKINVTGTYAALPALPDDWTTEWTRFDNTPITLNKQTFAAVALSVLAHAGKCHAIGRTLREQIDEATSAEAIAAIVWPADPTM